MTGPASALSRREFLEVLGVLAAGAAGLDVRDVRAAGSRSDRALADALYEVPNKGDISLFHFTDCHAQLLPLYYREPAVHLGVGAAAGKPPHLTGTDFLRYYGLRPGSAEAYVFTCTDFEASARRFGRVGGFAHLATLLKRLRSQRPHSLLLDGGDSWQGSATALWTRGQDMVDAVKLLGVDVATAHWEFTYGAQRVSEVVERDFKDRVAFVAQNVKTRDFEDAVFPPYVLRELGGVRIAVIGQAFPYTPIAHPSRFVPDWVFGLQEESLQQTVDAARAQGGQVVVLLSHNGMDVDLKLASRVRGIDVILGGHTHDAVPRPVAVANGAGQTLVTNAGSNGKYLGVLDLDVVHGRLRAARYRLLPVLSELLPADAPMQAFIEEARSPFRERLAEPLAVTGGLLYRRGNFNGSFDQVILDALMAEQSAEIAFSPGFRWGPTLLPGATITMEQLLAQTAITYPACTLRSMTGEDIKRVLEDIADNLFNPDPYYQQGGDMVRVGGLTYAIDPAAPGGRRISDMRLRGKPVDAGRTYKVAGWAAVGEDSGGAPVWEVVARHLRERKVIPPPAVNFPRVRLRR